MNREQTLARYAEGKDAWNAWATQMLARRAEMENSHTWAAELRFGVLETKNDLTAEWTKEAVVDVSSATTPQSHGPAFDFSGWIFPGTAIFIGAVFHEKMHFTSATFHEDVSFDEATFRNAANFKNATFLRGAYFNRAKFSADAGFDGAKFEGYATFGDTSFLGRAQFSEARFSGYADFSKARFSCTTRFAKAAFSRDALFEKAVFSSDADFGEAKFRGAAKFERAKFTERATFMKTEFGAVAGFEKVRFEDTVVFSEASFGDAARLGQVKFCSSARFRGTQFHGDARFDQSTFEGLTTFQSARFQKKIDFSAIRSDRAFTLNKATFHDVPDFVQASFSEAPRLDNLHFRPGPIQPGRFWERSLARVKRQFQGNESEPARFRALKRLAIQGHDHDAEMKFFAGEIKSARFVSDFPLTWRIWSGKAWSSVARFWFGWLYQVVADFGRSLFRPFMLWLATIALATLFFVGQSPSLPVNSEAVAKSAPAYGASSNVKAAVDAWWYQRDCYEGLKDKDNKPSPHIIGLAPPVREQTNSASEALHLAVRNAFIFLEGGEETAHRTYGCLYGLEMSGGNAVPIVPSNVSFASAVQKAFSGIFIFLFGLAVRNMLRMK